MRPIRVVGQSPAHGRGMALAIMATLGLAACAAADRGPPPEAQLGASGQAIIEAERTEGDRYAPFYLRSARQKLAQARAAMRAGDYEQARALAEQAQVDAELASVQSQNETAQAAVAALGRDAAPVVGTAGGSGIAVAPLPGSSPAPQELYQTQAPAPVPLTGGASNPGQAPMPTTRAPEVIVR